MRGYLIAPTLLACPTLSSAVGDVTGVASVIDRDTIEIHGQRLVHAVNRVRIREDLADGYLAVAIGLAGIPNELRPRPPRAAEHSLLTPFGIRQSAEHIRTFSQALRNGLNAPLGHLAMPRPGGGSV